jgi:hypothetical protein
MTTPVGRTRPAFKRPASCRPFAFPGLLLCAALLAFARPHASAAAPLRVLFIGNSLTAANDLPNIFASLAAAGGRERPAAKTFTVDGFSLEDHWNRGDAQKAIGEGPWDVVVLQQGPSALIESRQLLVAYARKFAEVIRAAGARPALYMVWPSTARQFDFAGVSTSYTAAAKAVNGLLLPAGDAWQKVLREHRDLKLYSDDGLHPTFAGSYLAALVIYQRLYEASDLGLPALGLPARDAERLQTAARLP